MASHFSAKISPDQVEILLALGLGILKEPGIYRHKKSRGRLGRVGLWLYFLVKLTTIISQFLQSVKVETYFSSLLIFVIQICAKGNSCTG